jgi:guanosine-3',5'-bis(diphosphate) 3'-pyrophosphohydrolase
LPTGGFATFDNKPTEMTLAVAIAVAAEAFKDTLDKAGEPYILHCLRVMNNLHTRDKELQSIAILHDVVEDTGITLEDLKNMGFSDRVLKAVALLTHDNRMDYKSYIQRIAGNSDARIVKLADLKDNSDITRLKGLSQSDFDRMKKYHVAFIYLMEEAAKESIPVELSKKPPEIIRSESPSAEEVLRENGDLLKD